MVLSVRKRRFMSRLAGYAVNPVRARARIAIGREQHYTIGGAPVTLPPAHNLPYYQRRDPTYDAYAEAVVADLARRHARLTVLDVGANVGDTAVAMLTAAPNIAVVSVEGDPEFAAYARRNLAQFGDRARVVEGFVGPVGSRVTYARTGTTGGFQGSAEAEEVSEWLTPQSLLADAPLAALTVWKSDIDGFDIHVLVEHRDAITSRCDVLWFEFDPPGTLGDPDDVARLIEGLATSGRVVHVYDNLGRRMFVAPPGPAVTAVLEGLTAWLLDQRHGHLTVPYLDLWAFTPRALDPST